MIFDHKEYPGDLGFSFIARTMFLSFWAGQFKFITTSNGVMLVYLFCIDVWR